MFQSHLRVINDLDFLLILNLNRLNTFFKNENQVGLLGISFPRLSTQSWNTKNLDSLADSVKKFFKEQSKSLEIAN